MFWKDKFFTSPSRYRPKEVILKKDFVLRTVSKNKFHYMNIKKSKFKFPPMLLRSFCLLFLWYCVHCGSCHNIFFIQNYIFKFDHRHTKCVKILDVIKSCTASSWKRKYRIRICCYGNLPLDGNDWLIRYFWEKKSKLFFSINIHKIHEYISYDNQWVVGR